MATVKENLKAKATFTFTLLGSEGNRSKSLALQFFPESDYYEFNQNDPIFHNRDFYYMLDYKVKTGMKVARSKNPDIIFWMGSNDYVPLKFFDDALNQYGNGSRPQMYGIDNYHRGKNAVFYCTFDGSKIAFDIHNQAFWWTGLSPHPRDKYHYCGGAIGLNKAAYSKHPEIIDQWSFDEGEDEMLMRNRGIEKCESHKCFFMNIKMLSGAEINTFGGLKNYFHAHIMKWENMDADFRNFVSADIENFYNLIRSMTF